MDDLFLNLRAFFLSLIVHGLLLASLAVSLHWTSPPSPPPAAEVEVVQAVAVDESKINAEIERLQHLEKQRKEQEEARQKRIEEQARKAKEMLAQEEQRLAELEERRRLEEARKRQEAERLEALKRQKEEEQKRLAKLKQEQEAEAKRLKALEEARKKAEMERKRAEQRAAEERRRREREEALRRKLAEEAKRMEAEKARKAEMLVERYKGIIRQKVERNWRRPVGTPEGLSCIVRVKLLPSGDVGEVSIVKSSGNPPFDASVKRAVMKASPLPLPQERDLFPYFRELEFVFAPKA